MILSAVYHTFTAHSKQVKLFSPIGNCRILPQVFSRLMSVMLCLIGTLVSSHNGIFRRPKLFKSNIFGRNSRPYIFPAGDGYGSGLDLETKPRKKINYKGCSTFFSPRNLGYIGYRYSFLKKHDFSTYGTGNVSMSNTDSIRK
jgi:hypothetical protein